MPKRPPRTNPGRWWKALCGRAGVNLKKYFCYEGDNGYYIRRKSTTKATKFSVEIAEMPRHKAEELVRKTIGGDK